eukprot:gene11961-16010_t
MSYALSIALNMFRKHERPTSTVFSKEKSNIKGILLDAVAVEPFVTIVKSSTKATTKASTKTKRDSNDLIMNKVDQNNVNSTRIHDNNNLEMFIFLSNGTISEPINPNLHQLGQKETSRQPNGTKTAIQKEVVISAPKTRKRNLSESNTILNQSIVENHKDVKNPIISFMVYGEPIALARHRSTRAGILYNPSAKAQSIFLKASQQYLPINCPLEGPLAVNLLFCHSRPKNHYKTGKNSHVLKDGADYWHSKRGDIDNLVKFVLDALNKHAYLDDSQVAVLSTAKIYTNDKPYVQVTIKKLDENDKLNFDKISVIDNSFSSVHT